MAEYRMKKNERKRHKYFLWEDRGETITETLVALLISALSVAMLVTMITTAVKITKQSTDSFGNYYSGNNAVAGKSDAGKESVTGAVTVTAGGLDYSIGGDTMEVVYYVNNQAVHVPVVRYSLTK